jgi:hypothetical protein
MDFNEIDFDMLTAENMFKEKEKAPPKEAVIYDGLGMFGGITNAEYHRRAAIGSSELKPALKSMNLYNEIKAGRVPFEETEAMKLGTATHAAILEAYDFGVQIAVSKKFGRKTADREEKAEFYAANKDKTIINDEQYEHVRRMRDSLLNLEDVQSIMATGKPEVSGFYVDRGEHNNGTNMLCKFRPDWENEWCISDVKTTRDVSAYAFSRTIHELNYHVSAAHYLEGSKALTGQTHNQFIFLAVEPKPPYESAVYTLNAESLELGINLRRNALDAIKLGRKTNEWPLINNGVAQSIGVPHYALNDYRLKNI